MAIEERWQTDDLGIVYSFSQCQACKNLINVDIPSCRAFELIPNNLFTNVNWHDEPIPEQDNKIIYEPLDK